MEPYMHVTLTVRVRDDRPSLLLKLADGELFNIPLGERPEVVAGLMRDLAGLVVAHARRQVEAVAQQLGALAKDR
jgi:hypothetical protein